MNETWHVVWDRSAAMPPYWQTIAVALLLVCFFLWLAWQRTRRLRAIAASLGALGETDQKLRIQQTLGRYDWVKKPLTMALIPLFVALVVALSVVPRWLELRNSLDTDGAKTAQGTVQSAKRWLSGGGARTMSTVNFELQVDGKTFRWTGEHNARHDKLIENGGGVLQRGKRVRVIYATLRGSDEPLRIEAENVCRIYLQCSGFSVLGWRWETKQ
jgi:hypothetical protein